MESILWIRAGKKHLQIKLQRFQNVLIWSFGWLIHQISSLYEALKLKQKFRNNQVVTGKSPFFGTGPFHTPYLICLNIGF